VSAENKYEVAVTSRNLNIIHYSFHSHCPRSGWHNEIFQFHRLCSLICGHVLRFEWFGCRHGYRHSRRCRSQSSRPAGEAFRRNDSYPHLRRGLGTLRSHRRPHSLPAILPVRRHHCPYHTLI